MKRRWSSLLSACFLLISAAFYPMGVQAASPVPIIPNPPIFIPDITIPIPDADPLVTFPDRELKDWVKVELRIYGDEIRQSKIDSYCEEFVEDGRTQLFLTSLTSRKIRSLEGIQAFASCNFQSFNAVNQEIEDVTPLASLTTLKHIALTNNKIEDVSALSGLSGLTTLALRLNRIHSLSGLESLTNLNNVDIRSNEISNIEAIRHWTAIKTLLISNNPIKSLAPLSGLTGLTMLEIANLDLQNEAELQHLRNLTALSQLDVGKNTFKDLAPLSGLTRLRVLNLYENQIADLSPIATLTNLEFLYISNNRIKDIEPLKHLPKLSYLVADHNWISSLKPVQDLDLDTAIFSHNRIDRNSAENIPAVVRWLSIGSTMDLSNQDLSKVYPFEDESTIGAEPEPAEPEATDPEPVDSGGDPEPADTTTVEDVPGDWAPTRGRHHFTDLAGHWAEEDIQWAYERGMVNGVGDGIFQPDGTTTEEQFLKMLLIAMGGLTEEPVSTPWSQKYYDFALDYHYPVKPEERNRNMTRTAVAELIAATQGKRLTGDNAIRYLLDEGLSNGKTAPTVEGYQGEDYLTRAEAVRFIRNVLKNAEYRMPQRLS